ncbi:MAG: hypothetical protein ACOYK8_09910 [Alphaproteobacteria bacterium]
MIIYRVNNQRIEILRILHSARDINAQISIK